MVAQNANTVLAALSWKTRCLLLLVAKVFPLLEGFGDRGIRVEKGYSLPLVPVPRIVYFRNRKLSPNVLPVRHKERCFRISVGLN